MTTVQVHECDFCQSPISSAGRRFTAYFDITRHNGVPGHVNVKVDDLCSEQCVVMLVTASLRALGNNPSPGGSTS